MIRYILLGVLSFSFLNGYEGEHSVQDLYNSIQDINSPTYEEYLRIQDFLQFSERPYLKELDHFYDPTIPRDLRRRTCRQIKLVGDQGEMPTFEVHHFGESESKRCILLYSTYNSPYPRMLKRTLFQIKNEGFVGDVIVRIGGYPWMDNEGIKLCHVPYSWKVLFLCEAIDLGYKEILYLDSSMIALNDLSLLFSMLNKNGYLFCDSGVNLDYGYSFGHHCNAAIHSNGITALDEINKIPHLATPIIGINAEDIRVGKVIAEWLRKTELVMPCMNLYPEELCFSIAAWEAGLSPNIHLGEIVCTEENKHLSLYFPFWSFLLDLYRE